jgi:hypothetical protein
MDKNNVLLLVLLLVSEIMGAVPEKYLWMNGILDAVCKVLKEMIKEKKTEQVAESEVESVGLQAPVAPVSP